MRGKGLGRLPKSVVNDSAASRKSEVGMALPLAVSTGTSTNDFLRVSNQVPPGGNEAWLAMSTSGGTQLMELRKRKWWFLVGWFEIIRMIELLQGLGSGCGGRQ